MKKIFLGIGLMVALIGLISGCDNDMIDISPVPSILPSVEISPNVDESPDSDISPTTPDESTDDNEQASPEVSPAS